jgi:rod shape-determining protein MreC
MNKKTLSYFFLLLALFIGATIYSPALQSPFITALNSLKSSYFNGISYINDTFNEHFFQAQKIKELTSDLKNYHSLQIRMHACKSELNNLYKENNTSFAVNPKIELVRALSYQKFGDFTRLWMDVPEYNSSKIYGLIYKDYVAGIVINENNKPLALLNSDIKSTYAVYIGKEKAPGIAHGNNDKNIVVSFIPAWFSIHVGDEVTTSGLDNIFFQDLKVGKVVSVKQSQGYQNAIVSPYFKATEPNYFYMIRSSR